jgi:hypothetical protein
VTEAWPNGPVKRVGVGCERESIFTVPWRLVGQRVDVGAGSVGVPAGIEEAEAGVAVRFYVLPLACRGPLSDVGGYASWQRRVHADRVLTTWVPQLTGDLGDVPG